MARKEKAVAAPVRIRFRDGGAVVTASGGAVLVLELLSVKRLLPQPELWDERQGWTDGQMLLTVTLLNCLGLDRVEDVEQLESDVGLCQLVRRYEKRLFGVGPGWFARRFRGGRDRTFPSARSVHEWLARSHDAAAGRVREKGVAYIPRPSAGLGVSAGLDRRLLGELAAHRAVDSVTLDLDATIVSSGKREAQFTYRAATGEAPGERGYQPMVAYCRELGAVVHTEFRDGNVPASMDNKRFLEETLRRLPAGITQVTVRADSAGYQEDLIRYCNDPGVRPSALRRFGVIRLVCGAPRSPELVAAVREVEERAWQAVGAGDEREVAEIPYVSGLAAGQKPWHVLRYLVVRRPLRGELGLGENDLPATSGRGAMRLRLMFTNIPDPEEKVGVGAGGRRSGSGRAAAAGWEGRLLPEEGSAVVELYYGRCGEGEAIHSILKRDFAGGMMPSGKFGANACWWRLAAVTHNVMMLLRVCALGAAWLRVRMKRLRAKLLHLPGRVVRHARETALVIWGRSAAFEAAVERLRALPARC